MHFCLEENTYRYSENGAAWLLDVWTRNKFQLSVTVYLHGLFLSSLFQSTLKEVKALNVVIHDPLTLFHSEISFLIVSKHAIIKWVEEDL